MKSSALKFILLSACIHHACEGHCPAKEAIWQERERDMALASFLQDDLFPHLFHIEENQAAVEGERKHESGGESVTSKTATEGPVGQPKFATCGTSPNVRNFNDECQTSCIWCPTTKLKKCSTSPKPNCIPWCDPFLRQASTPGIVHQPKFATCPTPINVRGFEDECTSTCLWCPTTKLKKCSTSPRPNCIPWCDPFFKEGATDNIDGVEAKKVMFNKVKGYVPMELRKYLGRLYKAPSTEFPILDETIQPDSQGRYISRFIRNELINQAKAKTCGTPLNVRNFEDECTSTCLWCPTTKLKKCSTSPRPNCIPWCDPFFQDGQGKIVAKPKSHTYGHRVNDVPVMATPHLCEQDFDIIYA